MKTKNGDDDKIINKGLTMSLECDQQEKEERIKCMRENRSDNMLHVGIAALQCGKETLEKSVSEATKEKHIDVNCEECMKCKHKEQWDTMRAHERNVFASFTPNMKKCITGINHNGERIKRADKSNKTVACRLCGDTEGWDHGLRCEQNKNKREE